ncbi:MAG: Type 1 glutamine amidotransferase-like domain-containing protein [Maioricimonas sp. JB049]
MQQRIVAIGGGNLALRETLAIDRTIVRFTEKSRPRALFIPTASGDSLEYCDVFQSVYGKGLKCSVEVLALLSSPPAHATMARLIRQADLIYVGGGNTLKMMRRWRRLGVDGLLRNAWQRGCVLSGISAGANCWFAAGSSDSMKFYRPDDWSFIRVRGLGLLKATCCPHSHAESREESFAELIGKHGGVGIALDNHTAIQIHGETYRVLTSRESGRAYRLERLRGRVERRELLVQKRFASTSDLGFGGEV